MFTRNAAKLSGLVSLVLGWRPDEFWAATPRELESIFQALAERQGSAHNKPLRRAELEQLMKEFPDGSSR
jgi:uncharacterized phage protein (TIGR02216 family)